MSAPTPSVNPQLWEQQSRWWVDEFTEGADPEYEQQIIPLCVNELRGFIDVLDLGTGEGQIARALVRDGAAVVGLEPTAAQLAVARERAGGPSYVRGVAEQLPLADASFDAVLACLVFEHLPDHRGPIREVARVLRPGGIFVFLLNHPVMQTPGSGWVIDHVLDEQYWRVGPYLETSVVEEELAPGVILPFVHRPLSDYVDGLADAGFVVERLREPAPPQTFLDRAPEYAETGHIPRLLAIRARKE